MSKLIKIGFRIFFIFSFLCLLFFIGLVVMQKKVTQKIVTELNQYITVPIKAEELKFSVFNNFPSASLQLNNVTVFSAKNFNNADFQTENPDQLMQARRLYVSVKWLALLQNKVEIKQIDIVDAQINVLIDAGGNDNFNILKSFTKTPKDSSELAVKIDRFEFKEVQIVYQNNYKNNRMVLQIPRYKISGDFYKKNYNIAAVGKIIVREARQGKINFNPKSESTLDLNLQVQNDTLLLNTGVFYSHDFKIKLNGTYVFNASNYVDLQFSASDIKIAAILNTLNAKKLKAYQSQGALQLSGSAKGNISKYLSPRLDVNFELDNATIKNQDFELQHIYLQGNYTNGVNKNLNTSMLQFAKFQIAHNQSRLSGLFTLTDFEHPVIEMHTNFNASGDDLGQVIKSQQVTLEHGTINGTFTMAGPINDFTSWKSWDFNKIQAKANVQITNVDFYAKNLQAQKIATTLTYNSNVLSIPALSVDLNQSKWLVKGRIQQLMPYLQNKKSLAVQAELIAHEVAYKNFESMFSNKQTSDKSAIGVDVNLKLLLHDFTYQKLFVKRASGHLSYIDNNLTVKNYQLNTCGGLLSGNLSFKSGFGNQDLLTTHASVSDVNITEIFQAFDNFSQNTLTDNNVSGKITTDFDLQLAFVDGKSDLASLDYLGHVKINNGRLQNFKPIMDVAQFSEISELEDIRFSSIENDLLINNQVIYIPEMDISSNAFDIRLNGNQYFNGDYQYHLHVFMSDFISGKAKRLQKQQTEFGTIADDGYGRRPLVLLAESKNGKSSVKIDKTALRKNLKTNLSEEKKELKTVLKNEFGWFKKDTTLKKNVENKPVFEIEWDEE